jgi:hypothetical protein
VLWYGLVIYPYEEDEEDDSGMVQQTRLMQKVARLPGFLQRGGGIHGQNPQEPRTGD